MVQNSPHGIPYPEGDDPIASWPTILHDAALAIDDDAFAYRWANANQSIPHNTVTRLTFGGEAAAADDAGLPGPAQGVTYAAGVFTVQTAGIWLISAQVAFAINTTGRRLAMLRVSQSGLTTGLGELRRSELATSSAAQTMPTFGVPVRLNAGATFDICAFQTSTAPLDVVGTALRETHVSARRLAP